MATEQIDRPQVFLSVHKQFDPTAIDYRWLSSHLSNLEQITPLGSELLVDLRERIWITDPPNTRAASSLTQAQTFIASTLQQFPRVGYITGGLEGIHLCRLLEGLTVNKISTFIIGLEESVYTTAKGRLPLFSTEDKFGLWKRFSPENSVIFVIPNRPNEIDPDNYYDAISQFLGLWKNPQVVYVGSSDDPPATMTAHRRRAATDRCCLNISFGNPPIHTSEFFFS